MLATAVDVAERAAAFVGGWSRSSTSARACPASSTRRPAGPGTPVNLAVQALDLAGGLEAATGRRPVVDNDVKAAALGAHHALRPAVPDGTTAYLNVGTGLAAAIVHRGEVVRGAGGAAGEIGHIPVGTGVPCSCGQEGCLETIASGTALPPAVATGRADLFPAAAAGDERAVRQVVETLAHGIALAVQVLVVTGAELVVIGGGLTRDRAELEAALAADIAARAERSPFLRRLDLVSRIRLLDGDVPVAAIGAALLGGSSDPGADGRYGALMEVVVSPTPEDAARAAADAVLAGHAARHRPRPGARARDRLLTARALPRARTRRRGGRADFSAAHGFALDEYVGLPPGHPEGTARCCCARCAASSALAPERLAVPDGSGRRPADARGGGRGLRGAHPPTRRGRRAGARHRRQRPPRLQRARVRAHLPHPGQAAVGPHPPRQRPLLHRPRRRAHALRDPGAGHHPRRPAGWCSSRPATPRPMPSRPRSRGRSRHPCRPPCSSGTPTRSSASTRRRRPGLRNRPYYDDAAASGLRPGLMR